MNKYYVLISNLAKENGISISSIKSRYDFNSLPTIMTNLKNDESIIPRIETLKKLEDIFKVKFHENNGEVYYTKNPELSSGIILKPNANLFPLVSKSSLSIGMPDIPNNAIIDYINFNYHKYDNCFAVRVEGNSLADKLIDDDIVLIDKTAELSNNCFVFARDNNGMNFIKRYKKTDEIIVLSSINIDYEPIVLFSRDIEFIFRIVCKQGRM